MLLALIRFPPLLSCPLPSSIPLICLEHQFPTTFATNRVLDAWLMLLQVREVVNSRGLSLGGSLTAYDLTLDGEYSTRNSRPGTRLMPVEVRNHFSFCMLPTALLFHHFFSGVAHV